MISLRGDYNCEWCHSCQGKDCQICWVNKSVPRAGYTRECCCRQWADCTLAIALKSTWRTAVLFSQGV